MRNLSALLALATLLGAFPAQAAHDTGLILPDTGFGQRSTGVGITAGIKIKLGPDRVVKRSERVKLGIAAGPVLVLPDRKAINGLQRSEASFVGLELNPGYSTSFNLAGKPVLADFTPLGAAERDEDDDPQSTGDKVAWVATVAGVVAVVVIGGLYIAVSENSD